MRNLFGIIGELVPIISGVYCILYFGGYKIPKTKENLDGFNKLKEKHGKKIVILGIILILFGSYNLTAYLM
jgi:hypothetical protein